MTVRYANMGKHDLAKQYADHAERIRREISAPPAAVRARMGRDFLNKQQMILK